MKDDLAYIFNGKQFISVRKNEMIHELIDIHTKEINLSFEKNKNKLNEKYATRLEKFLDMLNDVDTQFTNNNNQRTYPSYKAYKINLLNTIKLEEKII
jgi:DNA anti-recombination protein RmuC